MTRPYWRWLVAEERGSAYAAVEMVLVLGLILLPTLAGIAQLPRWVDAALDPAVGEEASPRATSLRG